MILADRLRLAIEDMHLSQAELARRVGVSQQTIAKLVKGSSHSSRHLHKIARELRTTPAFLSGETDDPDSESPNYDITGEEREILELLRQLTPSERSAALVLLRSIATSARSPSVHG